MKTDTCRTSLTELADGQKGVIVTLLGGRHASKRLADLGLTPGTEISVMGRALFSGPVRIEAGGSKLVIGRGLASKIVVEVK